MIFWEIGYNIMGILFMMFMLFVLTGTVVAIINEMIAIIKKEKRK